MSGHAPVSESRTPLNPPEGNWQVVQGDVRATIYAVAPGIEPQDVTAAWDTLLAERNRLRAALEGIAATEASMVYGGEKWVHWREQARQALDA